MESGMVVTSGKSGCADPSDRFRDYWARNVTPNSNVKVYIGAYAAPGVNGSGYVPLSTLKSAAVQMRKSFPSFGGVMLWDASLAYGKWIAGLLVMRM